MDHFIRLKMPGMLEKLGRFFLDLQLKRQVKDHKDHDHGKTSEPEINQEPESGGKIPENQQGPSDQDRETDHKSHTLFEAYPKSYVGELAFEERLPHRLKN